MSRLAWEYFACGRGEAGPHPQGAAALARLRQLASVPASWRSFETLAPLALYGMAEYGTLFRHGNCADAEIPDIAALIRATPAGQDHHDADFGFQNGSGETSV